MSKRIQALFILYIGLISGSLLCFGQAGRAELSGTIQDPSGLPVPKAKVEAEDQATMFRYSAVSDGRGEYHVLGLPAGQYVLTVEQPGFHKYRQSGITLRLAGRTALDLKLEVGLPTQSVEVSAAAPLLQTTSGEVSLNIEETKITTLPLDGRNFIPLVTLSPGVALPNGQFLPRINGSRPRTNEYIYDGISVLQPEPGRWSTTPSSTEWPNSSSTSMRTLPSMAGRMAGPSWSLENPVATSSMAASSSSFATKR
jgi:hypothetical protein